MITAANLTYKLNAKESLEGEFECFDVHVEGNEKPSARVSHFVGEDNDWMGTSTVVIAEVTANSREAAALSIIRATY